MNNPVRFAINEAIEELETLLAQHDKGSKFPMYVYRGIIQAKNSLIAALEVLPEEEKITDDDNWRLVNILFPNA